MADALKIILAFCIGYTVFISTFYYLAKLMFPSVEVDEKLEKLIEANKQMKMKKRNARARRFDVPLIRIAGFKHGVHYGKI